jgi:hypothetical protein
MDTHQSGLITVCNCDIGKEIAERSQICKQRLLLRKDQRGCIVWCSQLTASSELDGSYLSQINLVVPSCSAVSRYAACPNEQDESLHRVE